jgi:hypothetical protein
MISMKEMLKKEINKISFKRTIVFALVFGALLGVAQIAGYQLKLNEMTDPGVKGKALIVLKGCLLSVLFLPVTYMLFRVLDGGLKRWFIPGTKTGRVFFISWIIIWLSWLPAFLAYYPAILSYDFHRQFGEAVKGYIWFFEYQPLIHTFLIRMFWLLGVRLGDIAAGMAIFAIVQSLLLSSSISAGISYAYKKSGILPAVVWILLFAFLPFNPILAISMTKDILFSAFFVFLVLIIIRMEDKGSVLLCAAFVVIGILNILFRNNAAYALIFLIPAFLIGKKGIKKGLISAILALVMVVGGLGCKTLIRETMHAIPGSETEKFSVPIMQMVRVIKYQAENLTPEQEEILHRYIDEISWGEYYAPIADSAKSNVSAYRGTEWTEGGSRLIKDYLAIGVAYPNDYIDAFLALTAGYWSFFDVSHAEMLGVGDDSNLGLLYTFNASTNDLYPEGIISHSYLPAVKAWYAHVVNGNSYYNWPVISLLMKPAFYFWLFVYICLAALYKKSRKSVSVLAYPLFYLMTMFLGPCVNFRYMYPFIVVLPVLASFVLSERIGIRNDVRKEKRTDTK